MPWLARHVEFIQNRFGIRSATGLTPFETVNNRPYRGELLPWLSPCMVRTPGAEDLPAHLAPRWHSGDQVRNSRAVRAIEEIDEQLVNDIFGQSGTAQPRVERAE
eukprot:16416838-Heterocapsa_arctica.AAC.1